MKPSPFELVIFDCDGVLVDSEPLANRVFVDMLRDGGHPVDTDEYQREFSGASIFHRLEVTSRKLNWTPPADFLPVFHERLIALTERELKPVAGVREVLESLSVPICLASNGSREEILLRLQIANLTEYFGSAIFSGLEVPQPKPAPDVYLAAAKAFNIPPARCIVIEDSLPGVTAAVRAGMIVYGYAAFTPQASLRRAGALPFDTMSELLKILSEQNNIPALQRRAT